MKTSYLLILVLIAVIVGGWVIHYYSDHLVFGPGGEPNHFGMITVHGMAAA
jgi:hypothetical protein